MNVLRRIIDFLRELFTFAPPPPYWHECRKLVYSRSYIPDVYDCSNMSATAVVWYTRKKPDLEVQYISAVSPKRSRGHAWFRIRDEDGNEWHVDPAKRRWNNKGWFRQWPEYEEIPFRLMLAHPEYFSPFYERQPDYSIAKIA